MESNADLMLMQADAADALPYRPLNMLRPPFLDGVPPLHSWPDDLCRDLVPEGGVRSLVRPCVLCSQRMRCACTHTHEDSIRLCAKSDSVCAQEGSFWGWRKARSWCCLTSRPCASISPSVPAPSHAAGACGTFEACVSRRGCRRRTPCLCVPAAASGLLESVLSRSATAD